MQQSCHKSSGKRGGDAQIQNTTNDPLFLPPIDIVIPSTSIPYYFHVPKFFSTEIPSENFPPVSSDGKFLGDCYVPEIFVSQNSLEIPAESRGGK